MSLDNKEDGTPLHMPEGDFEFDEEVTQIFPDMAKRSIPFYEEMHDCHSDMALQHILDQGLKYPAIVDVGASRGRFAMMLAQKIRKACILKNLDIRPRFLLIDSSKPMCDKMQAATQKQLMDATVVCAKFDHNRAGLYASGNADIVVCHYVHQFVPDKDEISFMKGIELVGAPGSLLLWGEKERQTGGHAHNAASMVAVNQKRYRGFRLKNGYTEQEIDAKSIALEGSMFPRPAQHTVGLLGAIGYSAPIGTYRMGEFHSFAMLKGTQ